MPADPWIALAAAVARPGLGYPRRLHEHRPHPSRLAWPAALIAPLERRWNQPTAADRRRRLLGGVLTLVVLLVAAAVLLGAALQGLLGRSPAGV